MLAAANKVSDFAKFQKQQEDAIKEFKEQMQADENTINYVDDLNSNDVKENKSAKIAAKKKKN